jgi:succinate--hydroxymethylglutarate CoA-transferase
MSVRKTVLTILFVLAWGPPFVGGESAYYLSVNRNKKSIAVNLKSAEGRKILTALAQKCDIFVENFLPGDNNFYKF